MEGCFFDGTRKGEGVAGKRALAALPESQHPHGS